MKFRKTEISGVVLVEPDMHRDERGFFLESYHQRKYADGGIDRLFVQDNHSCSAKGTLRGLHMQLARPQGKLVRAIRGSVWDVAVDVRRGSPTFGRHVAVELSAESQLQLYLPPGLAHGFLVTSETAEFEYKCTDFYDPTSELAILWNDPELAIPWPILEPLLSAKDRDAPRLAEVMEQLPAYSPN
ncbi:MAG: dTDP-4-dehydrorhamnose 3,5-epimerase [Deltaproteobacteria bacterium]|nr:dTDP-4-dehydrorhamnose 3,5-epimerase [Deltaproteobacteria bacterium]MBW2695699.1 dTDP-4-dehydrorhamnose 3,5-epimerase [Deltaproteobacteria bacterium]